MLTISFIDSDEVAIAYDGAGCNADDPRQQVYIGKYPGWNGHLPAGRAAAKAAPGSHEIVSNR